MMRPENITFVQEPFTAHDLLKLSEVIKIIDNKAFTSAIAESLRLINNPPIFIEKKDKQS